MIGETFYNENYLHQSNVHWLVDRIYDDDVPQWISIKDRLPENNATVLIYEQDTNRQMVSLFVDGFWFTINGYRLQMDVTHWQQLPEPPEFQEYYKD